MSMVHMLLGAARIDNVPFRLHYSFTSGFLFLGNTRIIWSTYEYKVLSRIINYQEYTVIYLEGVLGYKVLFSVRFYFSSQEYEYKMSRERYMTSHEYAYMIIS